MRRALIWIVALLALGIFIRWVVYEHDQATNAAQNIKDHWDRVNAKAQLENDELRVQNDQLDIDITREKGKRPTRDQLKNTGPLKSRACASHNSVSNPDR